MVYAAGFGVLYAALIVPTIGAFFGLATVAASLISDYRHHRHPAN